MPEAESQKMLGEILKGFIKFCILIFILGGFVVYMVSFVNTLSTGVSTVDALVYLVPMIFAIAFVAIMYRHEIVGKGD